MNPTPNNQVLSIKHENPLPQQVCDPVPVIKPDRPLIPGSIYKIESVEEVPGELSSY
jgi:hypothetical protein